MANPVFGVALKMVDEEARPVIRADLSTIGIIGPASLADAVAFPLNTPVRVHSNQTSLIAKLGTSGYIQDALNAINDQLGFTQFAARCVVVRTAEGTNVDPAIKTQETINNIVGSSVTGTGVHAFKKSVSALSVTPRLIIAPGYTGQMADGVGTITRTLAGASYVEGQSYPLTFSGGGANAVQATAHALGLANGELSASPVLDTPGAWYESAPTITVSPAVKTATAVTLGVGGTGYAANDVITLANGVTITVLTVTGGVVTTMEITNPGSIAGTAADPTNPQAQVSVVPAGGTGATFNLTWTASVAATYTATVVEGANPVCAALPGVLASLVGHAIVESSGISQTDDEDWRETMSSQRLIPVSGSVRVLDSVTGTTVFRPIAGRIAGIAVRRDHEKGAPFHSWANQPIQGIVGPNRDIPFALTDDANEAQEMLRNNIGVIVRGELGNEFAIASAGFIFIGTDNAGEDELWRFYNMTRGRDFIHLTLLRAMRWYLGRYNITPHTINAILNVERTVLRDLKADGHILGYKLMFRSDSNSADEIRLGHVTIGFAAEEPAPLRLIVIESARYREAVDAMIADLAAQLNLAA